MSWLQSASWCGQHGVVISSDAAVHPQAEGLSGIGASAVAIALGRNSAMIMEPARVSFMKHAWDFYRPIG